MADENGNTGADNGTGENGNTEAGKSGTDEGKRSIEDMLSGLSDEDRRAVSGALRSARDDAANYRTKYRDAESKATKYDEHVKSQQSDTEKAQAEAKDASERATAANARAVKAEVKALAAGTFADPDDAAMFLGDLSKYVDKDGDVDTKAIQDQLKAVLERKPHLGKPEDNSPRSPRPDKSQASGGNGRNSSANGADEFAAFLKRQLGN